MDVQSWFQRRCCCYDENAVELLDYFIQNRAAKKQQQRLGQRTRDRFFLKVAKSHDAIDTIITTSQLLLAHLQHQHKNTISCIHFEKKYGSTAALSLLFDCQRTKMNEGNREQIEIELLINSATRWQQTI